MCAIFTGNYSVILDEVDSTNTYLNHLAANEKLPDGTLVVADFQHAGKGQRGNVWQADKGKNLTFSILYLPNQIGIDKQFLLTQAISLGVYDYLKVRCNAVKIKWPNDLYVGHKKIGGMLIENTIKGANLSQVIIGIGLNINQKAFNLPKYSITSLALENNTTYLLQDEMAHLLSTIEQRYLQWRNGHYTVIRKQYQEFLYLFETWHEYTLVNGEKLKGKIIGNNELGQLLVEDQSGKIHQFKNKEIIF